MIGLVDCDLNQFLIVRKDGGSDFILWKKMSVAIRQL